MATVSLDQGISGHVIDYAKKKQVIVLRYESCNYLHHLTAKIRKREYIGFMAVRID